MSRHAPTGIEIVALGSCVSDAKVKEQKAILNHKGKDAINHPINMLVHITGEVVKSPDEYKPVPVKVNWQKAFAYLLSKVNGTIANAAEQLTVNECISGSFSITDEMSEQIKNAATEACAKIVTETSSWTSGKTRFNGDVTVLIGSGDAVNVEAIEQAVQLV